MIRRLLFICLGIAFSSQVAIAQLTATITNQKNACDGFFNGSFDVTIDPPGTTGPYTVFVFGLGFGQTVALATPSDGVPVAVTGLRPDTYLVAVGDSDNATTNFSTFITILSIAPDLNVAIDAIVDNTDCSAPDGQINITVTGGTGSYSFLWTGPSGFSSTNEDISGLAGGSYALVVTDDGSNCSRSPAPITIDDPSPNIQNITTPSPSIVCIGSDAVISLSGSEPAPVVYQVLVNGSPVGAPVTNPAAPGPFSLTVPSASFSGGDVISIQSADGSCTPILMNGAVIINRVPLPTVSSVTGGGAVCAGDPLPNVTFNFTGAAPFTFTYTDGVANIPAVSPTNTFTINNAPIGTYQVLALQDNNSCNATALGGSVVVVVNPLPVPTVTGAISTCEDATEIYTTESGGGETNYVWTVQGGTITAGGTATDGSVTILWDGTAPHTVSVNYTDANGCTAMPGTTQNITVNPLPVPTLTGPTTTCFEEEQVYTTDSGGGETNFVWSVQGGTITAGGTASDASVTIDWNGTAPFSVSVNYDDVNGCVAAVPTAENITVNPLPVPALTGSLTTCLNASEVYNTDAGQSNYVWTVAGGTITSGGSATDATVTVTWDGVAPYEVSVSYTDANGCVAATPTFETISINPLPVPTITGPLSVCTDAIEVYATESGAGQSNYVWTVQGGTITAGGTPADATVSVQWDGVAPFTVSVLYTDVNACTAAVATTETITVNPLPVPTITGPGTVCFDEEGVYTTDFGAGETNFIWTVQGGTITAGGTAADASVTIDWNGIAPYSVSVNYTNTNGCAAAIATTQNITVNPLPVPVIAGATTTCFGSTEVYTTDSGAGESNYLWLVQGGTITAGGTPADGSVTVIWDGAAPFSVSVNYDDVNGCAASSPTVQAVTVSPQPVPTITGPLSVCLGSSGAYTTESGAGISAYVWNVQGGTITAGGTATDPGVTVLWDGTAPYSVSVGYTDASGCSTFTPTIENITVNPPPVPTITGPFTSCFEVEEVYSTESGAGETNYIWTVQGGTITAGGGVADPSVTVDWNGAAPYQVSVSYTDANGCVAAIPTVQVITIDPAPTVDAGLPQTICTGDQATLAGAIGGSAVSSVWSTAGDGIFDDATLLNATYLPGTNDIAVGSVTLTLSSDPTATCPSVSDNVTITITPLPTIADAGPDKTVCSDTNLEGNVPVQGTGLWTIISGVGGTIADANSPTSLFSGVAGEVYVLEWTISTCAPSSDQVQITFDIDAPTTAAAGGDQFLCAAVTTSATLAANTPLVGTGAWSIVSGAGGSFVDAASPGTVFNGVAGEVYVLRWTITSSCGSSTDDLSVSFEQDPSVSDAGTDIQDCGPTVALGAIAPASGTGTWSIISGAGGSLADVLDPVTDFTGVAGTTYTLRWTVSNSCGSTADDVVVIIENLPTIADAGADQAVCGATNLAGNVPVVGTGLWSIVNGAGGVIADPADPASSFSGVASTVYTLQWTISNAGCSPSSDQVVITIDPNSPTPADAGPDQQVCGTNATLAGNVPAIGTALWSIESGAGGSLVDNTDPSTDFSGAAGETYILRWTVTSGCGATFDEVQLIFDESPTVADAGTDQTVCGPASLGANAPAIGTGTWTIVSGSGGLLSDPADPASLFQGTGGVTYTLEWTISNGSCPPSVDQVDITFDINTPTIANAGADQNVCDVTTTLAGNVPVVGTGQWTVVSGAGGSFADDTDPATDFSGTAGAAYALRWTISNGGLCVPSNDDMSVAFDIAPTVADAGTDQQVCANSVALAGNVPVAGTGAWSVVSGAGGSFADAALATTTFNGTQGVTYTLRWTISNACGTSSDDVQIIMDENSPLANAGVDKTVCGPTNLEGNVPGVGTGTWTIIGGSGGIIADPNDPNSLFTGVGGTLYTLEWSIVNGTCPGATDQVDITFDINTPTIADAGIDQNICAITTTLAANTPVVGAGLWSIASGAGGSFVDATDPTTDFNGNAGETYVLTWTISNGVSCTPSADNVTIVFETAPTVADAGANQQVCGPDATLGGNVPVSGAGLWTITSGVGGSFADATDPATVFTGTPGDTYVLRWTISNSCGSSFDEVTIQHDILPTVADAGPDQVICGAAFATLSGNVPAVGQNGIWIVISGAGGAALTPNSPTSQFSGVAGTSYTLRWVISSGVCTPSTDDVVINFAAPPAVVSPMDVCQNGAAPTLNAVATGATSINWYSDAGLTNLVFTGSNYVPAASELDMTALGTTTFYVSATYTCGQSAAVQFVVNVVNTPGCGGGGTDCFAFTITVVDTETQRPSCSDQDDGVITLNVSGVAAGNYIVQLISPDETFTQIAPAGQFKFVNLSPAAYQFRIEDAVGNICQQPYNLPLATIVQAVASNPVDAVCYGEPSGSITLTITGGNSPYEYSVDGVNWIPGLISGGEITGLPANGTYPILVRDDNADQCPAEVMITINSLNPQIQSTFTVTPATCGGGDGEISIGTTTGGTGSGYQYSLNGGPFGNGPFTGLSGGMYTVTVRDDGGCIQDIPVAVTFPGFVNHNITAVNADCTNNGMSGSITLEISDAGAFTVALSTDQFNEPDDMEYQTYNEPSVTFTDLPRGTYFLYIRSTGISCPTRSAPVSINGTYAINFDITPVCNGEELSISLTEITGEPGIPFEIQVFKKFTNTQVATIPVASIPPTGSYLIDYASNVFLQTPGEYQIQVVQVQSTFCLLSSPLVDYTVPVPLFAAVGETKESYPDITNGSLQIINFSGPGPDYMTYVRIDSASVPGQFFESGPDVVPSNLNNQFEITYQNIPAGRYEVIVTDKNGCSRVLVARVPLDTDIYIPNIFTPNGDGVNDTFYIRNLPVDESAVLVISNRWGNEVYSSSSYQNNWDAAGVSDGVYFFRLRIADAEPLKGWIEVMRGAKP